MLRRLTMLALILAVLLAGCDLATVGQTTQKVVTYVGKAANSAAFVAVAVLGDKVWVYACDGQSIGQWFVAISPALRSIWPTAARKQSPAWLTALPKARSR